VEGRDLLRLAHQLFFLSLGREGSRERRRAIDLMLLCCGGILEIERQIHGGKPKETNRRRRKRAE